MFYSKAIGKWKELEEDGRADLVANYFYNVKGFSVLLLLLLQLLRASLPFLQGAPKMAQHFTRYQYKYNEHANARLLPALQE